MTRRSPQKGETAMITHTSGQGLGRPMSMRTGIRRIVRALFAGWRARADHRASLRELARLDDRLLKDIGISRDERDRALRRR